MSKLILILYSEYMPYNHIVSRELVKMGYSLYVVRYDRNNKTPYLPPSEHGIEFVGISSIKDANQLFGLVMERKPALILVAGTMSSLYCRVCARVRRETAIPVVSTSDAQFVGRYRWLKVLLAPLRQRRYFDYLFVAGVWQYEFARLLGFPKDRILLHNLSADVALFSEVCVEEKIGAYPKNILYIGRFSPEKGLDRLVEAWSGIVDKKGWTLTLVGNGPLQEQLQNIPNVDVKPFCDQRALVDHLRNAGCLILPSLYEPWALVIHEAAAAGVPIIASDVCGATPYFVLSGFNGHIFSHAKKGDLAQKINQIVGASEQELIEMSRNSKKLASRITPEIAAKTLISVIK